jgi:hypothetical protein
VSPRSAPSQGLIRLTARMALSSFPGLPLGARCPRRSDPHAGVVSCRTHRGPLLPVARLIAGVLFPPAHVLQPAVTPRGVAAPQDC